MVDIEESERESKAVQKRIYIILGVAAVLLMGVFVYLKLHPAPATTGPAAQPHLEGAIRPDSPDFAKLLENIRMDEPQATVDQTALGGLAMNLYTTVRNFTGKTITGLEMKGIVVDSKKNVVKERTLVVIPTYQASLEASRALPVRIRVEGFKDTDDRANIKMEITAIQVE